MYARYSTDQQNPRSIEDQVRLCEAEIERRGGALAPDLVFTDAAISGTSAARPGFQALQREVRARRVDVIVTEDLSRIGRDHVNTTVALGEFESWGARLLALDGLDTSTETAPILAAVKSVMAHEYIRELKKRTRRGLSSLFDAGMSTGGRVYGYRSIDAGDGTGRKRLEIDPTEAEVVSRIFELHLKGTAQRMIAEWLNAFGVASPRGGKWTHLTVRSMLRNEIYAGVLIYNRREWKRDRETGARRYVERPRNEWKRRDCPELRIIDAITWDDAQQRVRSVARTYARGDRPKRGYALSGLLVCAICGEAMTIVASSKTYYVCGGRKKGKGCSNARSLAERDIRAWVIGHVRDDAGGPGLLEEMRADWAASLGNDNRSIKAELARRRDTLSRTEAQISKLLDFIADGHDTSSTRTKLAEKEDHAELQRVAIARLEVELAKVPMIPSVAKMRRYLDLLPEALQRRPDELRHWLEHELLAGPVKCSPPPDPTGAYDIELNYRPSALLGAGDASPGLTPGTTLARGSCGGRI